MQFLLMKLFFFIIFWNKSFFQTLEEKHLKNKKNIINSFSSLENLDLFVSYFKEVNDRSFSKFHHHPNILLILFPNDVDKNQLNSIKIIAELTLTNLKKYTNFELQPLSLNFSNGKNLCRRFVL